MSVGMLRFVLGDILTKTPKVSILDVGLIRFAI